MALNRSKVGTTYPSYRYEVSREKIREYATSLGETDPRYLSDGEDCVAPPTFAACFTVARGGNAPFGDADLGAHLNLLHGAQAFIFGARPLRPGDVLVCTPRIADISSFGGSEILSLEVDCRFSDSDQRAVLSRSTIVFMGDSDSQRG
ncbi:MAG: MaoC family dehydratase N-terminal domain-containing protein [Nitriliruptorales bacterium]